MLSISPRLLVHSDCRGGVWGIFSNESIAKERQQSRSAVRPVGGLNEKTRTSRRLKLHLGAMEGGLDLPAAQASPPHDATSDEDGDASDATRSDYDPKAAGKFFPTSWSSSHHHKNAKSQILGYIHAPMGCCPFLKNTFKSKYVALELV